MYYKVVTTKNNMFIGNNEQITAMTCTKVKKTENTADLIYPAKHNRPSSSDLVDYNIELDE